MVTLRTHSFLRSPVKSSAMAINENKYSLFSWQGSISTLIKHTSAILPKNQGLGGLVVLVGLIIYLFNLVIACFRTMPHLITGGGMVVGIGLIVWGILIAKRQKPDPNNPDNLTDSELRLSKAQKDEFYTLVINLLADKAKEINKKPNDILEENYVVYLTVYRLTLRSVSLDFEFENLSIILKSPQSTENIFLKTEIERKHKNKLVPILMLENATIIKSSNKNSRFGDNVMRLMKLENTKNTIGNFGDDLCAQKSHNCDTDGDGVPDLTRCRIVTRVKRRTSNNSHLFDEFCLN